MSDTTTRGVRVQVESEYLPDRSSPEENQYFFSYTVQITNLGDEVVQLIDRHWVITNANGEVEHVRGPGVVGEQQVLEPGEGFEYTSFCPLSTSFGTMHGEYGMRSHAGENFDADIGAFALALPHVVN